MHFVFDSIEIELARMPQREEERGSIRDYKWYRMENPYSKTSYIK